MSSTPGRFTLRFRNPRTYELLGLVAERYGMSKTQLAEQILDRELMAAALALEPELSATDELLGAYHAGEQLERAIENFAEAEAYDEDPLKARAVEQAAAQDAHGVLDAFS